jgi:uncharacterized membrane protein YkoI
MTRTSDKIMLSVLAILLVGMGSVLIAAVNSNDATTSTGSLDTQNDITPEEAKVIALQNVQGTIQGVGIESENGSPAYEVEVLTSEGKKEVLVSLQGQLISVSSDSEENDEENDVPVTGTALEQASQVALAHIGEGRVTDSEIGDEEGYYEIEVTLDNGDEADVHLDRNFNVLSIEYD